MINMSCQQLDCSASLYFNDFFRPVILEAIHMLLLRNGPYLNSLYINIISSLSQNNVA